MTTLSITFLLSGILLFFACLPMVFGKVPMNKLYGMRTDKTFKNEKAWFHLNEVGGMIFTLIGFPLILAGILGFWLPESAINAYSTAVVITNFVSIAVALYFFIRYSNRYSKMEAEQAS